VPKGLLAAYENRQRGSGHHSAAPAGDGSDAVTAGTTGGAR